MKDKPINIHIYNTLCSDRLFDELFNNYNLQGGSAVQKFYKLLVKGFSSIENVNVEVNTYLPIYANNRKKIIWKSQKDVEDNIQYNSIPSINLPIIRNAIASSYVFFKILLSRFPSDTNNLVLVDFLRYTMSIAVILACKLRGIKVLTVATDMPGESIGKPSFKDRVKSKLLLMLSYDYYVSLTKQLDEAINKKNKPSLIIEGFADVELMSRDNSFQNKFDQRVLIYAGGLDEAYGLRNLVEAFKTVSDSDLSLWLYGTGPFVEDIKEYTKHDARIQYKGVVPNSELVDVLMRATLLINPRFTHEEYTKYSFPSKNMEYMSTGTPLLTTKLPGIPDDHFPYIYTIDRANCEGIQESFKKILSYTREEIHAFGCSAKNYIMREKNNVKQAEQIIQLIQESN